MAEGNAALLPPPFADGAVVGSRFAPLELLILITMLLLIVVFPLVPGSYEPGLMLYGSET